MMAACPLCRQPVAAPSLSDVIADRRLNGHEAAILAAVHAGGGHPVHAVAIFDEMWADDIDGGPSQMRMYSAFRKALCSLNAKLDGSGITVRSVGDRKGWRLAFTP